MTRPIIQRVGWLAIMVFGMAIVMYGSDGLGERLTRNLNSLDSGQRGLLSACVLAVALPGLFWLLQFVPGSPGPMPRLAKIGLCFASASTIALALCLAFLYP